MESKHNDQDLAYILIKIVNGACSIIPDDVQVALRVWDGDHREISLPPTYLPHLFRLGVPFHDNFRDRYTVYASAPGYRDAAQIVSVKRGSDVQCVLLLIRKKPEYSFPSWINFKARQPKSAAYLSCGIADAIAKANYEQCMSTKPDALACLLNLTSAMESIRLDGKTPLDYFRRILWDDTMAQDRFFAFADPALVDAVRAAADRGEFAEEPDPKVFHPDATCSFKQVQFETANVQLTFHENRTEIIDGLNCIMVEPDVDYYEDLLAHGLLEVLPNTIARRLTDPTVVYAMRWQRALDREDPTFDPGYTIA